MGCCGCDNKTSAITAGIFGLVQSTVGLILNVYFINLYSNYSYPFDLASLDDRIFLVFATYNAHKSISVLLVIAATLHGIWFLSSTALLIGNANNNACCVRQWVVWTSFVIIGDMIMPVVLIACTIVTFIAVFVSVNGKMDKLGKEENQTLERFVIWAASTVSLDLLKYYIILLMSFIKLGPITFIANICFNVFTDRRASDICRQRVQVVGTTVTVVQGYPFSPGMDQIPPGMVLAHPSFVNNSVLPQPGATSSSYLQNIPLQAGVTSFSSLQVPSDDCTPGNGSHNVCNDSTEYLIPPKLKNDTLTN